MNLSLKPLIYGAVVLMGLAGADSALARDRYHGKKRHDHRGERHYRSHRSYHKYHHRHHYHHAPRHYYPRYYSPYYAPYHPYYAPRVGFSVHL